MTVASVALQWQASGFSTIPILPNASKRPAVRWTEFMGRVASLGEVETWWQNGHEYGIAVIMGRVSGNVEMLEIEGRACDADSLCEVTNRCDELGVGYILDLLMGPDGYSEHSPSGGLHLIYRITDHPVPGNEKVARRPASAEELSQNPADKIKVLAETRGEGGYCIVAPSSGLCHPSGESWMLINGEAGRIPEISWEERCLLHEAVRRALDVDLVAQHQLPVAQPQPRDLAPRSDDLGGRPGDRFDDEPWESQLLLGGAGWTRGRGGSAGTEWTRPGKDPRDGISATTGRDPLRDRLYVFSSSAGLPTEEPLTKFHVYALLHHGGNHSAAARELRRLGYGEVSTRPAGTLPDFLVEGTIEQESSKSFSLDDMGSRERLAEYIGGDIVWVHEEKCYYHWNGSTWAIDHGEKLAKAWNSLTYDLLSSEDPKVAKWADRARGSRTSSWVMKNLATVDGVGRSKSTFNRLRGSLCTKNGLLDLHTGEFGPHRRDAFLTQTFNASYDPEAQCPQWRQFMEDVIPDANVRAYVQRACGYSMLGDADQRALFLVWGPAGTGKSQFLDTLQHVFGDYGCTASVGTFMASSNKGPSPDVHRLRGRRFVSTSETADNTRFDEETVKRLTGRDVISTRALYQAEQEWVPECAIWIATNHKPKFNSDDDAIWARSKLIPFVTRFGSDQPQITDFARKHLYQEADGILNWLLEGLQQFLELGLEEPSEIVAQTMLHRQEVDTVAMFLEDSVGDGRLVQDDTAKVKTADLHAMYADWCRLSGERVFGRRRFTLRVLAYVPGSRVDRSNGATWVTGLCRSHAMSLLGGFSLSANDS